MDKTPETESKIGLIEQIISNNNGQQYKKQQIAGIASIIQKESSFSGQKYKNNNKTYAYEYK